MSDGIKDGGPAFPWMDGNPRESGAGTVADDLDELIARLKDDRLMNPDYETRMKAVRALETLRRERDEALPETPPDEWVEAVHADDPHGNVFVIVDRAHRLWAALRKKMGGA